MKVVMISTDRNIFKEKSEARQRMIKYGALIDELHIIVFSKKSLRLEEQKISDKVWLYPTNSRSKLTYVSRAQSIGEKLIKESEIDLITTQDPFETGWAGMKLSKKNDVPLQVQVHTDFLHPKFRSESHLNKVRVKLAQKVLPVASCIRVVSRQIKESIIQIYGDSFKEKISVLPIFVDSEKIKSKIIRLESEQISIKNKFKDFKTVILIVSRLESEKNIALSLRVFKEILKSHPRAALVIVGEGRDHSKLKKSTTLLRIKKNVFFEGWKDNMAPYYTIADIFMQTSNYEGYGMSLVEAVSAGVASVSTNVGVAQDILVGRSKEFLCDINDKECFVNGLNKLISNEEFRTHVTMQEQGELSRMLPSNLDEYLELYKKSWEDCLKKIS